LQVLLSGIFPYSFAATSFCTAHLSLEQGEAGRHDIREYENIASFRNTD
jgi:hypothetical protein